VALVTDSDLTAAVSAPAGDAALVARLTAAADRAVKQYLGREFAAGPFTEYHPGGGRLAFLRHYPVNAVTSLAVDANREFPASGARPATSYLVHTDRGVIENLGGPFVPGRSGRPDDSPGSVRVVYTAATAVPADVSHAALMLAEHWYREAKTHAAGGQLNRLAAADGTTYPWGQSGGYKLPATVLALLARHRTPAV
jgi:hypothetical protein